ncbi:MAG TPA: Holliday junction resolvase RuvX [Anaerolineales bacterium]|nr:Holliday junction resolvase RuvX [Anaerolineales bacterium]
MRYLAVDYGTVRIGLALSDASGLLARPFRIIKHIARQADAEQLAQIVQEIGAECLVIGLPMDEKGELSERARSIQRFGSVLAELTVAPIIYWDESLSSQDAEQLLAQQRKKRQYIDDVAAAVILQGYLDYQNPTNSYSTEP